MEMEDNQLLYKVKIMILSKPIIDKRYLEIAIVMSVSLHHGPKNVKRQIVPYFDVHETKMMGPFKIMHQNIKKNLII